ncbi:glycosyltransferase [Clostridium sp. NSJ-145]|uniref:glycosyltransferase n=1 Tax=Clostridium sp. NSJ-145 TaxID=2897777 RepID=UPI001E5CF922|nr:glycosyltransferase [Clostridium sp. NSJ-145]MCD2502357.1 glycosyltransferase [Clostridium sp. NSJ-145]
MKKIRVLQSVGSLGVGGNEIFVMNFFRNIDKEKFQVDFVIYDDRKMDFYDEVIAAGSKVYICKSNMDNKYLNFLYTIKKVIKILRNNKYDIIHCHSCSFIGIFKGAIAGNLVKGTKVISHSHNPGMPKNTFTDEIIRNVSKKYLSRIVDFGFACSDIAGESKYTDKFIKSSKYAIINNAIEVNKFIFNENIRNEMRKKYDISNNEVVIGNIGRLEIQKNQEFLLKIFAEIQNKNSLAKLIIIGEGSLEESLKKCAIKNRIEENVIFAGKVSNPEKYYHMMDTFVLTSFYEGFPFVMVESQVNGLPAVVSNAITKSVNILGNVEFVSLDDSVEIWADKILKNCREIESVVCNNYIYEEYDLKYQAKKLEKYYVELLNLK